MLWVLCVTQEQVDQGIANDGSNLSGVSGRCSWEDASLESALHLRSGGRDDEGEDNKENSLSSRDAGRRESGEAARRQLSNYGKLKFFSLDSCLLFVSSSELHNKFTSLPGMLPFSFLLIVLHTMVFALFLECFIFVLASLVDLLHLLLWNVLTVIFCLLLMLMILLQYAWTQVWINLLWALLVWLS